MTILQKITELADRVFCIYNEPAAAKGRKAVGEDAAGCPENAGGVLVRWPWRREARPVQPRPMVSRAMELKTAKEILVEVFHLGLARWRR